MRTVFVNGDFCTEDAATISIFDRGFLFADGVYEVSSVLQGKLVDNVRHLKRLHRSLAELDMECPLTDTGLIAMQKALVEKNQLREGLVYIQVTRGPAERDFAFPKDAQPSIVAFTQSRNILNNPVATTGMTVVTAPDIRWRRCDIKTIGLLPSSMTKQEAINQGASDAWMVDEQGYVTEGTSSNCYIVTRDNQLVTRPLSREILHGITRRALLQVATELTLNVAERAFKVDEAYEAKEAFISSATTFCLPVVSVDGHKIGDGKPGPVYEKVRAAYIDFVMQSLE